MYRSGRTIASSCVRRSWSTVTGKAVSSLRHDVTAHKDAPPSLGPRTTLTCAFIDSMVRSLSGSIVADVLPANILAKGGPDDRLVDPGATTPNVLRELRRKAAELNGRVFPQPPLVWRSRMRTQYPGALQGTAPAGASTKLAVAPYWNLSDDGRVCTAPCGARTAPRWGEFYPGSALLRERIHARKRRPVDAP